MGGNPKRNPKTNSHVVHVELGVKQYTRNPGHTPPVLQGDGLPLFFGSNLRKTGKAAILGVVEGGGELDSLWVGHLATLKRFP